MREISLHGPWQLFWCDGERGQKPDYYGRPDADCRRALAATVPGGVHTALLAQGVIAEPATGLNVLACRWVEEMLWTYRRNFELPALAPGERAWLVADSVDLAAVVYLNGREVGRHANSYYPLCVELTPALVAGTNTLAVRVEAGLWHAAHKSVAGHNISQAHDLTKRPWLRKIQSSFTWDWSPRLLNVGLFGEVKVVVARAVRVVQAWATTALDASLTQGTIVARAEMDAWPAPDGTPPGEVTLTVRLPELGLVASATCPALAKVAAAGAPIGPAGGPPPLRVELPVARPELWHPVGHGAPRRYAVEIEVSFAGEVVHRQAQAVGFRHVEVSHAPHPHKGRYCHLKVNGRPVFAKGGNYVPNDLLSDRMTPARTQRLVELAQEQNFNLLRVWGGGLYENEAFYDACDAAGILVWQEFVYACAKYPVFDEAWLADVKREARYQIRRLAPRPSLVIWCGNNEMEMGCESWGYDKGVAYPDYALFHFVLPRLLRDEDGTRYYQPSSPWSPDLVHPNDDHQGDQHPWSLGFADFDFRKYRQMECRFPNEGGILGPTALPTVEACLAAPSPAGRAIATDLHNNSVSYWSGDWIRAYCPETITQWWLDRDSETMGPADYVYWAGLLHGEGLFEYARNFRRRAWDSAAAIFWMFNDIWPTTRSWTTVDYFLRRCPSFHPVRRGFQPVTVFLAEVGDELHAVGANDTLAPVVAQLRFGIFGLAGGYPHDETATVTLAPNAATVLARWSAATLRDRATTHGAFAHLTDPATGALLGRDRLFLPKFKELQLAPAAATAQLADDGSHAIFTSDTFVWGVCLDLDGERPLPDNFFDLLPGVPYHLPWDFARLGPPRVVRCANPAS